MRLHLCSLVVCLLSGILRNFPCFYSSFFDQVFYSILKKPITSNAANKTSKVSNFNVVSQGTYYFWESISNISIFPQKRQNLFFECIRPTSLTSPCFPYLISALSSAIMFSYFSRALISKVWKVQKAFLCGLQIPENDLWLDRMKRKASCQIKIWPFQKLPEKKFRFQNGNSMLNLVPFQISFLGVTLPLRASVSLLTAPKPNPWPLALLPK